MTRVPCGIASSADPNLTAPGESDLGLNCWIKLCYQIILECSVTDHILEQDHLDFILSLITSGCLFILHFSFHLSVLSWVYLSVTPSLYKAYIYSHTML